MPQGRSLYRQFAYVSAVAAAGRKTFLAWDFLADEVFMSGHVCVCVCVAVFVFIPN